MCWSVRLLVHQPQLKDPRGAVFWLVGEWVDELVVAFDEAVGCCASLMDTAAASWGIECNQMNLLKVAGTAGGLVNWWAVRALMVLDHLGHDAVTLRAIVHKHLRPGTLLVCIAHQLRTSGDFIAGGHVETAMDFMKRLIGPDTLGWWVKHRALTGGERIDLVLDERMRDLLAGVLILLQDAASKCFGASLPTSEVNILRMMTNALHELVAQSSQEFFAKLEGTLCNLLRALCLALDSDEDYAAHTAAKSLRTLFKMTSISDYMLNYRREEGAREVLLKMMASFAGRMSRAASMRNNQTGLKSVGESVECLQSTFLDPPPPPFPLFLSLASRPFGHAHVGPPLSKHRPPAWLFMSAFGEQYMTLLLPEKEEEAPPQGLFGWISQQIEEAKKDATTEADTVIPGFIFGLGVDDPNVVDKALDMLCGCMAKPEGAQVLSRQPSALVHALIMRLTSLLGNRGAVLGHLAQQPVLMASDSSGVPKPPGGADSKHSDLIMFNAITAVQVLASTSEIMRVINQRGDDEKGQLLLALWKLQFGGLGSAYCWNRPVAGCDVEARSGCVTAGITNSASIIGADRAYEAHFGAGCRRAAYTGLESTTQLSWREGA
ncbi:hypothetical protein CYMTET_31957 [Cymbomonas tetramitiformis]|uniref:Uncharacterized protein n=1 Tax=Cymbomonas tetramitiformis TaxID=36881 RepID=A0AAE0KSN1_9CHLO|nr:hypothetical protein CYMTET_31957 [Cymbomonas tetramitiformis]